MKYKTVIFLVGAGFILGYMLVPTIPSEDSIPVVITKRGSAQTMMTHPVPVAAPDTGTAPDNNDEAASFAQWQTRFDSLITESGSREAATILLLSELDRRYAGWVEAQLAPLTNASPIERLDPIVDMEELISEGAAAILDHLEIPGSRLASVLAAAKESLSAEIQYGEAASSHEQRVSLLRLDRERELRLGEALASSDENTKLMAMTELDSWYDAGLRQISGSDELN